MTEWINPKDRMPPHAVDVLVTVKGYCDGHQTKVGYWSALDKDWFIYNNPSKCGVTGWMPLPAPRVPVKHVRWVNVYVGSGTVALHTTKEEAEKQGGWRKDRIACIRVEFTEGEGL